MIEETNTTEGQTPQSETVDTQTKNDTQETTAPVVESSTTETKAEDKEAKNELPKGVKKELFNLRKKIRELNEKLLEKSNSTTTNQINLTPQEEADLLADPKKWEQIVLSKMKNEVKNEIYLAIESKRIDEERKKALEYLSTQPELSDEDFKEDLIELLSTPEYRDIETKYPMKAAKMALMDLREMRGVNYGKSAITKIAQSSENTPKTSSLKNSGSKLYKRSEIEAILTKNPEKFDEIMKAVKEGRVI